MQRNLIFRGRKWLSLRLFSSSFAEKNSQKALKGLSTPNSAVQNALNDLHVSSRATPGRIRMRRRKGQEEAEMDSTIARIIGSDWGDRRNQPVSFAMRFYWILFVIFMGNGVYSYLTGKDGELIS